MNPEIKKPTDYGVFIIESLREGDVPDGKIMHRILSMSNISSEYHEAKNRAQLDRLIVDFKASRFRYLHLSCHATTKWIEIGGKQVSNKELAGLLKGGMTNKRLFMSACHGANLDLAKKIITGSGAMSLIGTPVILYFSKSVLFWPSFYHIMNEIDSRVMKRKVLISTLQRCTDLFGVAINYYSRIKSAPKAVRRLKIRAGQLPSDKRLDLKIK